MTAVAENVSQTEYPDGRVTLSGELPPGRFVNEELSPVPVERRTWRTYNFAALWIGMAHNIPSWTLASGLVALGMDWKQAVLTIALGNLIVLIPMLLDGHAGTKYGIPFPVFARASFGLRGANLPALIRGAVACTWFGIQTWIGGEGFYYLAGNLFGGGWRHATEIGGYPITQWASFLLFWILEVLIIWRGMEALRRFENWAAPFVLVSALVLLGYITAKAGGIGPILSQPSKLGWGSKFWDVFFPSLMGMIGFWATMSLNIPDFTRFGGSQRAQLRGQSLALPTTMTGFALLAVLVTSGSEALYGKPIWDPIQLAAKFHNPFGLLLALVTVTIATLSCNVAANTVSPAYDFTNLVPKLLNFRRAAMITCVLGIVIFPWKLIDNPKVYIFTWLGVCAGVLAPVAAVLIADYWVVRRTKLELAQLYTPGGKYWYGAGWNWRALVAFAVGALLSIGGSYSAPGSGPFPADGMIPFLKPLNDYSYFVGFGAAFILYLALTLPFAARAPRLGTPEMAPLEQPA